MNNPENGPVDVEEARAWLKEHKEVTGKSWRTLAQESGLKQGTISGWIYGNYGGNDDNIAAQVIRFRQLLTSQAEQAGAEAKAGLSAEPAYIVTPTAKRLRGLMIMAHSGAMTIGATGPGTGKTMAMADYAACVSNVWTITIRPTTGSLAAMVGAVAQAIGGKTGSGWVRQLSAEVIAFFRGRNALLIVDEAGNLDRDALEELRSWHDLTGVGICLLGNEELISRIRAGGHSRHTFGRLNSRIAMSHIQDMPLDEDIDVYLDAWAIGKAEQRNLLRRIALTPGAGGLREIKHIVRHASMLAMEDDAALSLGHLREAMSTRATSHLRLQV